MSDFISSDIIGEEESTELEFDKFVKAPPEIRDPYRRQELLKELSLEKDLNPTEVENPATTEDQVLESPDTASELTPGQEVNYRGRSFTFLETAEGGVRIQNAQGKRYFIPTNNWEKFYKP